MPPPPETPGLSRRPILRWTDGSHAAATDELAVEEPLEIVLGHGPAVHRQRRPLAVTMRTPGNDVELALGFLFTEGLITDPDEVVRVEYCMNVKPEERGNVVRAELRPDIDLDPARWQRNFYTTSSCGVCGKSSLEAVHAHCKRPIRPWGRIDPKVITALPDRMRDAQTVFRHTGGIHAAALFDREGKLLLLREDIGRHNAVDKVIGWSLLSGEVPLANRILAVSGSAGFEIVQKAIRAAIPVLVAVGAASSSAVDLAHSAGMALHTFVGPGRGNLHV